MEETIKVTLRTLLMEDYIELRQSMMEAYAANQLDQEYWKRPHIEKLLELFPEGQLCILVNDKVVGSALSLIVDYAKYGDDHTYEQITGSYSFNTHDPKGDFLYGIEVFIHPEYRGLRLGRRLYDARKELCERLNLKGIAFGGRIPNYHKYASQFSPQEYIRRVKHNEIYDPILSFQLSNDFHVKKVLKDYLPFDKASLNYSVLLEWNNIYYETTSQLGSPKPTVIRLGLIQWQMRPFDNFDALCEQIEFFVDALSGYKSDFALFPEFFNAPLMAAYNDLSEADAVRKLADYTDALKRKLSEFAVSYNINIIGGSMPLHRDNLLYNVGYLCRRDGTIEIYEKIHITPSEESAWGMVGGDKVRVFDTDCGKIGVVICYDVEFPELPRLLAEQGMQILFVPFLTDTQNGYTRVRCCAQARAIENECYVAIAGCVGNLPKVHNMDIQYAQSAVFTPSDFPFPNNAIKAEATPNTEMTLIADVDLDDLKELHNYGSVRNLKDRRTDLYQVKLLRNTGKKNNNKF